MTVFNELVVNMELEKCTRRLVRSICDSTGTVHSV